MAGTDPEPTDGVRRRRSTHRDETGELVTSAAESQASSTPERRPSTGQPHRVRFSADLERPGSRKRSDGRSSGSTTTLVAAGATGENARDIPLRLDTDQARSSNAENIMGGETTRSPPSMFSPTSPTLSGSARTPILSPKTRNRGLSLRSSMFMKSMGQRSSSGNSVIELQDISNSTFAFENDQQTAEPKKKRVSSVTISPIEGRDSSPPSSHPSGQKVQQRLQGASALPHYQQWVESQARWRLPLARLENVYDKARKFVLRIQDIPPSKNGREVLLDASRKTALTDERTGKAFVLNSIRSSKYNAWNFVPRQLFAQFSKLANAYFLLVSILQMIPGLSTTGTYTTIIPLLFFVSLSMAKEGYEDLRRHRLDKAENNREAKVLHAYQPVRSESQLEQAMALDGPVHWARVKWHSLQVGDIIKLERDEPAPADIVLLGTRGANNIAYVETMALDGETNLKTKQPPAATREAAKSIESLAASRMQFVVEDPNLDLYNFEGKVTIDNEAAPLTNNEVIYRGSILRNTPEAIGIVIYSGEECKMRMNANKSPRIKAPKLQSTVNRIVVIIVFFVIFLALFNTIAYQIFAHNHHAWYLQHTHVPFGQILTSFIIMFNTMVPLSLYVSLEIIKLGQMVLMDDVDMYDPVSNTPFEARTSTINEELGQVSYVFSDKTGTLTENVMRFRKLSVAGTSWLHDTDLQDLPAMPIPPVRQPSRRRSKGKQPLRALGRSLSRGTASSSAPEQRHESPDDTRRGSSTKRSSSVRWRSSAMPAIPQIEQSTVHLIRHLQLHPHSAFAYKARNMLLAMALCHTCLPERIGDEDKITYQASSPDELALVQAAQELGFVAFERNVSTITLKTYPHGLHNEPVLEHYEVLDVIEFSSKRKRMSIVVRYPDGRIAVICKGADSAIMKRLRLATFANRKLAEIEDKAMERKSMEADQALRRKSSQLERKASVGSFPRTSTSLARRPSAMTRKLAPIRDDVDGWLNEREQDVDSAPRLSAHFHRASMAPSDVAVSVDGDDEEDEPAVIDEASVMDEAFVIEKCLQQMNDFATEGLRTLLYAARFLDDTEYKTWKKVYLDATTSLVDRQIRIEQAGELIEQQLDFVGVTAIEDKLQRGVPETIDRLRRANIKMWMLTGDKRETAINIGHSCRLIKDYSSVTVLDWEAGDVEQNIAASIIDINRESVAHSVVVVDGQTLAMLEMDHSLHTLFVDLAILADSVICCRASPSQKAGLVSAIRKKVSGSVTLAIGDGANDIAMIQEAHVGIGITGKEGLQAARTSDYSIAQFRFLAKLLLVHGRWNYIRTCKYTVGTFWKEYLFYLTQALYQHWDGYTGVSLYESWSLSMFNTLFTSLPVIFLGIFEQDLRASTLLAVPELYTKGQRSEGFNLRVWLSWIFMGTCEAMLAFFVMLEAYATLALPPTSDNTIFPMGDISFTACIILIVTKLQITEQRNKTYLAAIAYLLSVGGWFLWNIILSGVYTKNFEYDVQGGFTARFGRSGPWWCTLIIAVLACLTLEVAVRALKAAFFPTDAEVFQTLESDPEATATFHERAALWLEQSSLLPTESPSHSSSLFRPFSLPRPRRAKGEAAAAALLPLPHSPSALPANPDPPSAASDPPLVSPIIETEETPVWIPDPSGSRPAAPIQDVLSAHSSRRRKHLSPVRAAQPTRQSVPDVTSPGPDENVPPRERLTHVRTLSL